MQVYNIFVTSRAQANLAECLGFVLNVSKEAANVLKKDFEEAIYSLRTFPERNPPFKMPKYTPFITKKHVVNGRYIFVYSIENSSVIVYAVLDSRRNFEQLLK